MTQGFTDPLPREEPKSLPVSLRFCGRLFSGPELELLRVVAHDYSGLAVTEIARTVCELLEWKRPNGRLKDHECRQLLERLAAKGVLRLPALRPTGGRGPRRVDLSPLRGEPEAVECAARECEPLELVLVEGPAESRLWREYVERYHYLGSRRLGKSLRPSSAAVGNPRGCQPLSWNLLSSGQLDLCGADHRARSHGSRAQGSRPSHQRHLRLSVGPQREAPAMQRAHPVNKSE